MLQFKLDHAIKQYFEEPTKFVEISDFVLAEATGQDDAQPYAFWVIFNNESHRD